MLTASLRRTAVLVSLIAVCTTSGLSAAAGLQNGGARPVLATTEFLDRVLSFLRPHLEAGCKLDPDGRCHTNKAQPPHTKAGCHIDPDGRCLQ
jgi:hypothetical protein